jgi:hypothetical protein
MPRPQFTLRALLVAMLVVAAFFGGSQFGAKRERERLIDERIEVRKERENLMHDADVMAAAQKALGRFDNMSDKELAKAAVVLSLRHNLGLDKARRPAAPPAIAPTVPPPPSQTGAASKSPDRGS